MSAPVSDSGSGLAFSLYAPTPLAEAWATVRSQQGTAAERLARRWGFLEHALQLVVGVLDAERKSLGLPAPRKRSELIKRIDRPTLGQIAEAARDLARVVGASPDTELRELTDVLAPRGGPGAFERALTAIIAVRNRVIHDRNGQPSEAEAAQLLVETAGPLREVIVGLDVLKHTPIIVADQISDRHDGSQRTKLIVFQGPGPEVILLTERLTVPRRLPLLLTRNGVELWLAPWIMFSSFGESELPHLRALSGWDDQGPTYGRPGFSAEAQCPDLPPTTCSNAHTLLDGVHPATRMRHPALAALWLRIRRRDDGAAPPNLAGYRVERLLGRGASGAVWRATEEDTRRSVALKVLHPALAESHHQRERMVRERDLLRRISHPGVARVYDLIPSSPVGPVLVMEAVEGTPLHELAAERPFDPTSAAQLCAKVLDALSAIHASGLVHRDVKPSNILVDLHGAPRLVDFGVARAEDLSNLTGTVDVVGTVAFAAPEQLAGGTGAPVDGRADLFALGRMLPILCSAEGDWGTRLGRLPGALQCIVRRATQEDPAQRYPNAASMQQALQDREVEGWDGPPVGVGDLLPGGLRLIKQLDELVESVWLFEASPRVGGVTVGVLIAGAGATGSDELTRRMGEATSEALHQARCGGLRSTEDGLVYAELRGDQADFWARRLLGVPEPEKGSTWTDTNTVTAVLGGVAALAAGALGALGFGMAVREGIKKTRGPSSTPPAVAAEPPSRDRIVQQAFGASLLLHALAHAGREAFVEESTWAAMCASPLKAPLRVLGNEGELWCGPVGQALGRLQGRKAMLMAIAGLSVPVATPNTLKGGQQAVAGLNQVLDAALGGFKDADAPPYARRVGTAWEVQLMRGGERTWARVR